MRDYAALLPDLPPKTWRRIRGEQDLVVRYARRRAIETFPALLADARERELFLELIARLDADPRLLGRQPTADDRAVAAEVLKVLGAEAAAPRLLALPTAKAG